MPVWLRFSVGIMFFLLASVTSLSAEELIARAHYVHQPSVEPVVGQKVVLQVDVLTTTWFASAPVFPDLQLANAVVIQPSGFAVNFNERINGVNYTGQRREYLIYPQQAGNIAAQDLRVVVSMAGEDGKAKPAEGLTVSVAPLAIQAITDDTGDKATLVASQVTLEEHFSTEYSAQPDQEPVLNIVAGNAIERRITVTAQDTLSMLIPPLSITADSGVRLYVHEPALRDATNRGESQATRVERISYYFEREGTSLLPAVSLRWWHPEQQVWYTQTLPAVKVMVSAAPFAGLSGVRSSSAWFLGLIASVFVVLLIVAGRSHFARTAMASLRDTMQQALRDYRASESYLFRQLAHSAKKADSSRFHALVYRWLDAYQHRAGRSGSHLTGRDRSLRGFAGDDAEIQQSIVDYQVAVYGKTGTIKDETRQINAAGEIVPALKRRRAMMLRAKHASAKSQPLPALNPD